MSPSISVFGEQDPHILINNMANPSFPSSSGLDFMMGTFLLPLPTQTCKHPVSPEGREARTSFWECVDREMKTNLALGDFPLRVL